jgi:hypothetical protein
MPSKKSKSSKSKSSRSGTKKAAERIPAEWLPRLPLEQVLRVADTLYNVYDGKGASTENIAKELGLGARTGHFSYLIASAFAYGIVNREQVNTYSLSETGRKIIAPKYDEEATEGIRKAVLNPFLPAIFYSDYDGHALPPDEVFPGILEKQYGVPRNRIESAMKVIVENGLFSGIIQRSTSSGQLIVNLSGRESAESLSQPKAEATPEEYAVVSVAGDQIVWSKTCFYITPIGEDGSDIRKHADMMLNHLLMPVLKEFKFEVVRADKIERSGLINQQIFEYLVKARLCVADLSFSNPNAFYELGVRHICKLPTIQVIRKGDKIPFDVAQGRTITVDTSDIYTIIDRIESAKRELTEHIKHFGASNYQASAKDNPVQIYLPELKVTLPK